MSVQRQLVAKIDKVFPAQRGIDIHAASIPFRARRQVGHIRCGGCGGCGGARPAEDCVRVLPRLATLPVSGGMPCECGILGRSMP